MYDKFFCKNINIYIIIYIHITLIYFFNTLSYYTIPFETSLLRSLEFFRQELQ